VNAGRISTSNIPKKQPVGSYTLPKQIKLVGPWHKLAVSESQGILTAVPYSKGSEYLETFNINAHYYCGRNVSPMPSDCNRTNHRANECVADRDHGFVLFLVARPCLFDDGGEEQEHEDHVIDVVAEEAERKSSFRRNI
jgi:hypothetical protein